MKAFTCSYVLIFSATLGASPTVTSAMQMLERIKHQAANVPSTLFTEDNLRLARYAGTCIAGVLILSLMACFVFEAVTHWFHQLRFLSCQRKVQRVHETCLNCTSDQHLCPCCVSYTSVEASPSKMVFLCGHQFHMACLKTPEELLATLHAPSATAPRCPICEEGPQVATLLGHKSAAQVKRIGDAAYNTDEARAFMLRSLHTEYPDIIPDLSAGLWSLCTTEMWLSEMRAPQYKSIFFPARPRKKKGFS